MRERAHAEDGFTLVEMLVVLAILGTVLGGLTVLFTGAINSQSDQSNRAEAQQDARLGLDRMRREIRCASDVTTASGYPASAVTITLGTYCPTAAGATTVTWCTKDKNGTSPPVPGAQPYTLWRYTGSSCSGTGTQWASNLVDSASPSITAGKIFDGLAIPAASLNVSGATGGTLLPGTYWYVVTAVRSDGTEVPGAAKSVSITSAQNAVSLSWSTYLGASTYNVYGRGTNGVVLLKNVAGTSYLDTGPTSIQPGGAATSITITDPATPVTIPVASTTNFPSISGANWITFGASGVVRCTGITASSFTGCIGARPGQYPKGMPVDNASTSRPPSAALSVSLALDKTPANTNQRFVLTDNITLRNSRPS